MGIKLQYFEKPRLDTIRTTRKNQFEVDEPTVWWKKQAYRLAAWLLRKTTNIQNIVGVSHNVTYDHAPISVDLGELYQQVWEQIHMVEMYYNRSVKQIIVSREVYYKITNDLRSKEMKPHTIPVNLKYDYNYVDAEGGVNSIPVQLHGIDLVVVPWLSEGVLVIPD